MKLACVFLCLIAIGIACPQAWADEAGTKTFSYGEHQRQKLDVLVPAGAKAAPVLIFFHGGGWVGGDKKNYGFLMRRFSHAGVVSIASNYRLSPEVQFPAFVEDGASAIVWVRKNIADFGGDPNRIFLMGHSAGAHIVSLLALDEKYLRDAKTDQKSIRGVIPISGPLLLKASQVPQMKFIFGNADDAEMCPLAHVDGGEAPFLILQGQEDVLVQPIHAKVAEKKIREKGGKVEVLYFPDHDHLTIIAAFSPRAKRRGDVFSPVLQFIETNSK